MQYVICDSLILLCNTTYGYYNEFCRLIWGISMLHSLLTFIQLLFYWNKYDIINITCMANNIHPSFYSSYPHIHILNVQYLLQTLHYLSQCVLYDLVYHQYISFSSISVLYAAMSGPWWALGCCFLWFLLIELQLLIQSNLRPLCLLTSN